MTEDEIRKQVAADCAEIVESLVVSRGGNLYAASASQIGAWIREKYGLEHHPLWEKSRKWN